MRNEFFLYFYGMEPGDDGSLDKDWNLYVFKMSYCF